MSVWLFCALLVSLIGLAEQDGLPLSIKELNVSEEKTETSKDGAWVLNVEWTDENNEFEKVSYDIEIIHTEQMRTVHLENIHVKADKSSHYHWKWTSPIPLQCTSHSVRLRRRDQHRISEWTSYLTYTGQDQNSLISQVYPRNQVFMIGSNITFCCILKTEKASLNNFSKFVIRISNRTYITESHKDPFSRTSEYFSDVDCEVKNEKSSPGASVFFGYPPDDQNLTCITRDLSFVECHWKLGRKTQLYGTRVTNYTLNGRKCEFNRCDPLELKQQITNWTLIARNALGMKIVTDIADPTHRVWLKAPYNISHAAHARNATVQWSWSVTEYASLLMICQVMLNGNLYNKTFSGKGLASVVLEHLQPFTKYTAKVSCGSHEHFYQWGDWSEITFTTKEDIPELVDIWMQYSENNTYVQWKPLSQQQSHGIITGYKLTTNNLKSPVSIGANELCYSIASGNEKNNQIIKLSAKNSAGLSPPSVLIVPRDPGKEVSISRINSTNGGLELFWKIYPNSTCGYVVEWFPTYNKTQCAVDWKKIPECDDDVCQTWIPSGDFEAGERYTISVFACTDEAPVLLQRSEGYAIEQKPQGTVQNLRGQQNGRNVELSWMEVALDQQKGFILGYKVKTTHSESKRVINTIETKAREVNLLLDPGSYIFTVCAFTSVGESEDAILTMNVETPIDQMLAATVVGCSAATLVFIIITVLCYRKREWLKDLLYPDIPEPKLAGKWTTQGIYCTQITEGYVKCEIQEVNSSDNPTTTENPPGLDPHCSKMALLPAQPLYYNTTSPCAKKLISIIENPSYSLTTPRPVDVAQKSEPLLEMQDSYLPATKFAQPACSFPVAVEDTYIFAPRFVKPTPILVEDTYLPAPKIGQPSSIYVEDTYLPAPKFGQPSSIYVEDTYSPAPKFVQPSSILVEDTYLPAPKFGQPSSVLVEDTYLPAPKFVQPCSILVEDTDTPAPKFVQPTHIFVEDTYLPVPKFVQPSNNFVQDSYLPAPKFVQPDSAQNNVVVKDSTGYKPQST
ncbi:LIF receptor subunit alpha b isoform X2 [Danio aesculapii]|uniref:LIF receptor subunit alpha b isoform X2 n=1 Tax=Danio aesculapii TaxID=1142201 RepID=UPI0024C03012|nr:LIF receptor subunit alpha b isoform X2 [Danio aesculapii]